MEIIPSILVAKQEEFEKCYVALTNAAMEHIFKSADERTYNQLISFF